MRYVKQTITIMAIATMAMLLSIDSALAQRDAGSKIRGEYNFYGGAGGRSMRGARDYSRDYTQYARTAPAQQVNPEVAREAADSIGQYITKAQKHMAAMRKHAAATNDKETLTSLDSIDKNLADAAKSHAEMHETCLKDNVDAAASMECCKTIDGSLSAAITEHDKLMKRLSGPKPAAK
ncbi:MAG: hypothetical protein WD845_09355 [Pirellulales bacterium]